MNAAALCTCGIQAIGRCGTCGKPFCLSHQARELHQKFTDYCTSCQGDAARAKESAIARRRQQAAQAWVNLTDPYERLVVAVGSHVAYGKTSRGQYTYWSGAQANGLREACPEVFLSDRTSDLDREPPWNSSELAKWFARVALERGVTTNGESQFRTAKWSGWRRRFVPVVGPRERVWTFAGGSSDEANGTHRAATIFQDGRLVLGSNQEYVQFKSVLMSHDRYCLRAPALTQMANMLGHGGM